MKLCVFLFVFVFIDFIKPQSSLDNCKTPDNSDGTCINIRNCKPMLDFLASQKVTPEVKQLLKSYQCGFEGRNPKVCCPARSQLLIDDKQQLEQAPPDVKGHRNLNLLPQDCGYLDTDVRIIGGNKTSLFEFPWMALFSYRTDRGPDFQCGGTIINNKYIITAAHCLVNLRHPLLGVRIGEHDIRTKLDCETQPTGEEICSPPYRDLAIERTIPHPRYDAKAFTNDVGLVRVASRIKFNTENIRPICLPLDSTSTYNFTARNVIVTGWGVTNIRTGESSPDLLKVELPFVPLSECKQIFQQLGSTVKIDYHQLCAGAINGKDSCGGDSGGPLQVVARLHNDNRYIQQGIVSFGLRNCGEAGAPGVYTKIAYFMDWILDNLQP